MAVPFQGESVGAAVYSAPENTGWCDDGALLSHAAPAVSTWFFHPAFQSLLLPLLLAVAGLALLRLSGPRWTALGAALGLVVSLAVWPGFDWPAGSWVQKLPWATLVGLLVAVLVSALRWPGSAALSRRNGLIATGALALASLLLVAWAGTGGSILLAQLALMVGAVSAVASLWAWRSPCITPASLLPLVVVALFVALAMAWMPPGDAGGTPADDPYYTPRWN